MASIHDFSPSSPKAGAPENTDFSTNYGFIPSVQALQHDADFFTQGLYAYANMNKDSEQAALAKATFGDNLVPRKFADYWVGAALVARAGAPDTLSAFTAFNIPIPEGISDEMQLTSYLGKQVLSDFSADYDAKKNAAAQFSARVSSNFNGLFSGSVSPADLSPQQVDEIIKCYGYNPQDIAVAGQLVRSRDNDNLSTRIGAPIAAAGTAFMSVIQRGPEAFGSALKGNFSQAARIALKGTGSSVEKAYDKAFTASVDAWSQRLARDQDFLKLANNPYHVQQLAGSYAYKREQANLKNSYAFSRILSSLDKTATGLVDAVTPSVPSTWEAFTDPTADDRTRRALATAASIDIGKAEAKEELRKAGGVYVAEDVADAVFATAPFAHPATAIAAMGKIASEQAGQSYLKILNPDGSIPADEDLQIAAQSASYAVIAYATRAAGMKLVPRVANKAFTKLGVPSAVGAYIGRSAWTGFNFATVVPAADAALRAAYDSVAVSDPRLRTGVENLYHLWNVDVRSPRYWTTQMGVGAVFGLQGCRAYGRASKALADKACMSGLSVDEAASIARSTPIEELPQAYSDALARKIADNPYQAIADATVNTQNALNEAARLERIQQGKDILFDNAKRASLKLQGITINPSEKAGYLDIRHGGRIDPVSGKFLEGDNKVSLPEDSAAFYIAAIFDAKADSRAKAIRNVFYRGAFLDAAKEHLKGKVSIEAILDPLDFDKIIRRGKEAEAELDRLVADMRSQHEKQESPSAFSEADARARVGKTVISSIHPSATLSDLIAFGKEATARREQQLKRDRSLDPDTPFLSNAYVISKQLDGSPISKHRIFRITQNASAREVVEEYAEQWLKDFMEESGFQLSDTWRLLSDISKSVKDKDISLTSLRSTMPELADLLDSGATDADISDPIQMQELRRDVTEGLSLLLISDLRAAAARNDSSIPAPARELFDAKLLTEHLMEQEMAIAAALDNARAVGSFDATAARLLDAAPAEIARILQDITPPTVDTYVQAFRKAQDVYQSLFNNPNAKSLEQIEQEAAEFENDAFALNQQIAEADAARNAPLIEAVKELESLPENKDVPHDELVQKVNQDFVENKETMITQHPNRVNDPASTNGSAVVIQDADGTVCHYMMVPIASLKMMPNFKSGADSETGEVNPLDSDYHPDHDPIRILRDTDGSLFVISGRHRLAHAKRFNASSISAYVYDKTAEHDFKWAQFQDIKWNIEDNQASVQDVALLVRGELIDGIPPLDPAQCKRLGLLRKGSQALRGYNIGINSTSDLIDAWRNDPDHFTDKLVEDIGSFAPNDILVQRRGIQTAADGSPRALVFAAMAIEKSRILRLAEQGVAIQLNLFKEAEFDSTYNDFVLSYSLDKVKHFNSLENVRKLGNRTAKDKDARSVLQDSGLRLDKALHDRNAKKTKASARSNQENILIWQNPWTNWNIVGEEIDNAFQQAHPEEWKAMQERKAQSELQNSNPPADEEAPANSVQGDIPAESLFADFSLFSSAGLEAWQIDPSAGLGTLGHFADSISSKFNPIGHDIVDERISAITQATKRRIAEIQHLHGSDKAELLVAEMSALLNQIVAILPQGYRFSLEPYLEFSNIYAALRKSGDPDHAPQSLPMDRWPGIMANSFRNQFTRLLNGKLSEQEESAFFSKYNREIVETDLSDVKSDLNKTKNAYIREVQKNFSKEDRKSPEYKQALADARARAYDEVNARHAATFETAFKALSTIRAEKLMNKFFDRALLKLDQFRKDRILFKIAHAIHSITPKIQPGSKPSKGTVSMETYNTALTNYRLLLLTKSQKDAFEEANPDLLNKKPTDLIEVPTYDENGEPITISCSVQQYETYASLESMSADHALATSQTLGTFITAGKEAWQLQAEQEASQISDFCSPILNAYKEKHDDKIKRAHTRIHSAISGKGPFKFLKRMLVGAYNDGQFFDVLSSIPHLDSFKKIQQAVADAHAYMEHAEKENQLNLIKAAAAACGHPSADPLHLTKQQRRDVENFMNDLNAIHYLSGSDVITLSKQAPDFKKQHTAALRTSLLKRLRAVTRSKNYNPNELTFVLNYMRDNKLMPAPLIKEAIDLYGLEGDPNFTPKDVSLAINNIFPPAKFQHLHNINISIESKTAASLEKWNKENSAEAETISELTKNEAAYRVLLTEQADYADMLRRQGYTPEVIAKLKKFAGEKAMSFAYSLRSLLNQRMPTLKAIYEATYGTPFPVVENYFRAFFDAGSKESNDAQLEGLAFGTGQESKGGMRLFHTRVKHNNAILPHMDVTQAFHAAMKQQDNIIAYTDPTTHKHLGDFLRKALAHQQGGFKVMDAIKNAAGEEAAAALTEHVENMYRLFGYAEAYNSSANRVTQDIGLAGASTLLLARITSLSKNVMAVFNTLGGSDYISPREWLASGARIAAGQGRISVKDILNHPLIKDRFKEWDTEAYTETILQQAGVKSTLSLTRLAKRGLSAFGALDRSCSAVSAAVLYDATYRKMQKENPSLTHDFLHTEAINAVSTALGLKGQPMDFRQRPLLSTRNSFLTAAFFFLGGEAYSTFGDCMRLLAKSGLKTKAARHALANFSAVWLVNGFIYSCLNLAFNALLDDEEHWRKRNIWATLGFGTLFGPIAGMPILSNIAAETTEGIGRLLGFNMPYISTPSYLPMSNIATQISNLGKVYRSEASSWDKAIAANDCLRSVLFLTLLSSQRPTSKAGVIAKSVGTIGAAASNVLDFFLRLARSTDERFITPVPPPSPQNSKKSKQSRKLNKISRQSAADDLFPL